MTCFLPIFKDMAGLVVEHMSQTGTKVITGHQPLRVQREDESELTVEWQDGRDTFNTILLAIGNNEVMTSYLADCQLCETMLCRSGH